MSKINRESGEPVALYQDQDLYLGHEGVKDDGLGILSIREGLTSSQIDQLIHYANTDDSVATYSSDPKRFKNKEAFEKWLEKGRSIYSMADSEQNLLGIVWFGKSKFPQIKLKPEFENLDPDNFNVTFALRVYDHARGKGIAKKLTAAAFSAYLGSEDYKNADGKGIWLETSEENIAAVKTYSSLFTQVSDADEKGKIVMVLDPRA